MPVTSIYSKYNTAECVRCVCIYLSIQFFSPSPFRRLKSTPYFCYFNADIKQQLYELLIYTHTLERNKMIFPKSRTEKFFIDICAQCDLWFFCSLLLFGFVWTVLIAIKSIKWLPFEFSNGSGFSFSSLNETKQGKMVTVHKMYSIHKYSECEYIWGGSSNKTGSWRKVVPFLLDCDSLRIAGSYSIL